MKKILCGLIAFLLATSLLAGCSVSITPQNATEPGGSSAAAQSSKPTEVLLPSSSQESSQSARVESSQESSTNANISGMSGRLADAYISMFNSGSYYMKFRAITEYDGEETAAVSEVALKGGDMAMIAEIEGMGTAHLIVKEGKTYIIDHESKTIMVLDMGNLMGDSMDTFTETDFEYKGTGTGELFGIRRTYEEYSTDAGDARFYFDGSKLVGYEVVSDSVTSQMEILEMSTNIPSSMFEIPADYEELSF